MTIAGWRSKIGRTDPTIVSLSLGANRRFLLRHRATKKRVAIDLRHGDLLIMEPPMQRFWLHALPKTERRVGTRINLTFRKIGPRAGP